MFGKIVESLIALVAFFFLLRGAQYALEKLAVSRGLDREHTRFIYKLTRLVLLVILGLALLLVWDVNAENLWVMIGGLIGIVAIGFFAVWSLLSNVVAGFVLFLSDTFGIGDTITVLPEDITGKVIDLKLMFVVVQTPDGSVLHVPNNLLIQKIIKKHKAPEPESHDG